METRAKWISTIIVRVNEFYFYPSSPFFCPAYAVSELVSTQVVCVRVVL